MSDVVHMEFKWPSTVMFLCSESVNINWCNGCSTITVFAFRLVSSEPGVPVLAGTRFSYFLDCSVVLTRFSAPLWVKEFSSLCISKSRKNSWKAG